MAKAGAEARAKSGAKAKANPPCPPFSKGGLARVFGGERISPQALRSAWSGEQQELGNRANRPEALPPLRRGTEGDLLCALRSALCALSSALSPFASRRPISSRAKRIPAIPGRG